MLWSTEAALGLPLAWALLATEAELTGKCQLYVNFLGKPKILEACA